MKKLIIALALATLLVLAFASLASANGGPHGGYTATTDACAGCHRAHTAAAPNLLQNTGYQLCLDCHGASGAGADTNVLNGIYTDRSASTEGATETVDGGYLLGGGFDSVNGKTATSTHDYTGSANTAWGFTADNRGTLITMGVGVTLDCSSCHDPHGNGQYRILKATVAVTQVDDTGTTKDYDTEEWPQNLSNICVTCHAAYHDNTEAAANYTHNVDVIWSANGVVAANPETTTHGGLSLPLADTGASDWVTCNTCHFSHGTSATMEGFAANATFTGAATNGGSALLRLDNRGVCEVCHRKGTGSAAPVVTITGPAFGATLTGSDDFTATATDVEDVSLTGSIAWDYDGTSFGIAGGSTQTVNTSGWPANAATVITATVTDTDGNTSTASITVDVP